MTRRFLVLFLGLSLPSGAVSARTWHVLPDGSGDAPTIQAALDSTSTGDVVELADGVYSGPGNRDIVFPGPPVTLRSASGDPATCVIDCEGAFGSEHRGFRFIDGQSRSSLLEGITVRNGYTINLSQAFAGAVLIQRASPTVSNCVFESNTAAGAGAVSCAEGASLFVDCIFRNNVSNRSTGAVGCGTDTTTFRRCQFFNNAAGFTDIAGCMQIGDASVVTVESCTFAGNSGAAGGAFYANEFSITNLSDCLFYDNIGGAIYVRTLAEASFTNCTIVRNAGHGLDCRAGSAVTVSSCLVTDNTGLAISCGDSVAVTCSNLHGNDAGDWASCVAGQISDPGNVSADPFYCGADADNFHVRSDSPCAPENSSGCGLIGALPVGCGPVSTTQRTWGRIKETYR